MTTEEIVKALEKGACKFTNVDNLSKHGFIESIELHLTNIEAGEMGCYFRAKNDRQIPLKILKKYGLQLEKNNIIIIGYSKALRAIEFKEWQR